MTAWASAWSSSNYEMIEEMPFTPEVADYRLMDHVNDVTRTGLDLARRAAQDWDETVDPEILVPILILHDVDKPLLYLRERTGVAYSRLAEELPHGVVGAMLLKDLGFHHRVVSTVALHAVNAPFHGRNREAYLLHYADMFSADHAHMVCGKVPFYQRHSVR
ncbi:HD domain-containing protein [Roseomonas sp. GCM10028921]